MHINKILASSVQFHAILDHTHSVVGMHYCDWFWKQQSREQNRTEIRLLVVAEVQ